MTLQDNELYMKDVAKIANLPYNWALLKGKKLAISGGTGMVGTFLVDVLMYRNMELKQNTDIYILGRDKYKAADRFAKYGKSVYINFVKQDVNNPIEGICEGTKISQIDYIIHAASNTHPMAYSEDPIGTISANIIGTKNLLDWATKVKCKRFVFLSSVEVYGENRGDVEKFSEEYMGYIDSNTLRAGYPESKRCGEALCQAYIKQRGMDVVIPRLSRVYGPTMLPSDTKALSQFIQKGIKHESIVLKSQGTQKYSYSYVADAVSAIFRIMFDGKCGEAYNVASDGSDIMLKDLAGIIANYVKKNVVFELPDAKESQGYSKATKAMLNTDKLKAIGWQSLYDIDKGLTRTIDILNS